MSKAHVVVCEWAQRRDAKIEMNALLERQIDCGVDSGRSEALDVRLAFLVVN